MTPLRLAIGTRGDRMACAAAAIRFARAAGAESRVAHEIGLCVAELVSNVERHAEAGELTLRVIEANGRSVEIVVDDVGPGIADVHEATRDGWSRGRMAAVGEPLTRRSLGVGLGAALRLADSVAIDSRVGEGTRIVVSMLLTKVR